MRPRHCLAIAVLFIVLTVPAVSANAAHTSGIRVIRDHGPAFLIFRSAKCSIRHGHFEAVADEHGWQLVVVLPFSGFHHYQLSRGSAATDQFIDLRYLPSPLSQQTHYASDFIPPYPVAGIGGAVSFSSNGSMMGAGFLLMFNEDGSAAVDVAGGLRCHYPRRRH